MWLEVYDSTSGSIPLSARAQEPRMSTFSTNLSFHAKHEASSCGYCYESLAFFKYHILPPGGGREANYEGTKTVKLVLRGGGNIRYLSIKNLLLFKTESKFLIV